MIDVDLYVNSLNGSLHSSGKTSRPFFRGLLDIQYDLITCGQQNRPFTTVCELGIGGGGKQNLWKRCGADLVVGIDILDESEMKNPDGAQDKAAQENLIPGVEYYWNMDGYNANTLVLINRIFDLVLDDGDTGEIFRTRIFQDGTITKYTNKKNVLNVWRDWIADDGLFISETPDGYEFAEPRPLEYHMPAFEHLASTGMVIFDTSKFKAPIDLRETKSRRVEHMSCHMGVYTKRWDIYKPAMEKYKDHIICGKENIK